ncbi:MAG: hypothetical protein HS130_11775 [Deltaproteobacteria bacterium]|nr:hypothetical protein [Deltaproteobacteria bacterium]MCL4874913.1 hypothetical protein [bacterium]
MPREMGKKEGGGPFLDLSAAGPKRFAVKPVPCAAPGPAFAGSAIFINRVRYGPAGVNGARHIEGVMNGRVEAVILVARIRG